MKKIKSQYPDREPGQNYVTAMIAVILVAVLAITALAELQ